MHRLHISSSTEPHSSTKLTTPSLSSASSRPDSSMSTSTEPNDILPATPEPYFPLLRLPRDIRERIYSYVLISPITITWPAEPRPTRTIHPALIVASRTISEEAGAILYKENTFRFLHPSDANMFNYLCMPAFARSITRLHVPLRDKDTRLWFPYFSSTNARRSLIADFPALKKLDITFFSMYWQATLGPTLERYQRWPGDLRLREICLQLEGRIPGGCEARVVSVNSCMERELAELLRAFPNDLVVVSAEGEPFIARRQGYRFYEVEVVLEMRAIDRELVLG